MAKKKKLEELDAELAALEAELAALEGKATEVAAPKPRAPTPQPVEEAPAEPPAKKGRFSFGKKKAEAAPDEAPAAEAAEASEPKRFGLSALKKGRKAEAVAESSVPAAEAPPESVPQPPVEPTRPAKVAEPLPSGDLTHWRRDGTTWVRAVPEHEPPAIRRILDENEETVREEPATRADVDEVTGVKAERGVGKLFGGGASSAASKLKSFRFGKRGGDDA